MRAIVCERCGSGDVVEQDGGYVCEACGVRYVAEGGGTQAAGVAAGTDNLRRLALRARAEGNAEAGARYYGRLLEADPDDWEAGLWAPFFEAFSRSVATAVGLVARHAREGGVPSGALAEALECASSLAVDAARSATGTFLREARRHGGAGGDVPGLADALAACAAPLTSLAASIDGTFFRDGERDVAAPYAEEARVRARQLAQRVPARVRRAAERLDSMVGELPSGDVRRFPSAAWESGLDGIGLEELGVALGGRSQGAGPRAVGDDEPHGLLRTLAHRLLDALLRALDGTPLSDIAA